MERTRERLKAQIKRLKEQLGDYQRKKSQEKKQIESLRAKREPLEAQITQQEQRIDDLQNDIELLKTIEKNQRLLARHRSELDDRQSRKAKAKTSLRETKAKIKNLESQKPDLPGFIGTIGPETEDLQKRIQSLKAKADNQRSSVSELEQETKRLKGEIKRLENDLAQLQSNLERRKDKQGG